MILTFYVLHILQFLRFFLPKFYCNNWQSYIIKNSSKWYIEDYINKSWWSFRYVVFITVYIFSIEQGFVDFVYNAPLWNICKFYSPLAYFAFFFCYIHVLLYVVCGSRQEQNFLRFLVTQNSIWGLNQIVMFFFYRNTQVILSRLQRGRMQF